MDNTKATEMLYKGKTTKGMDFNKPEAFPLFCTTSFTMKSLEEVREAYASKYTYVRTNNPDREALAEIITYLEGGEKSLIFSSGMGAITSTLMTFVSSGDHILCNSSIYGETFDVLKKLLPRFGVESTLVDFTSEEAIREAILPNTKIVYAEVMANPTMALTDIPMLANIAHEAGAMLIVDNTFTSPMSIQPLALGTDIVINSLTKFINGHSDAIAGSITSTEVIANKVQPISMLCGTPGDPFAAWMTIRGVQTIDLRLERQMSNATALAKALEDNPHVLKVNHPSLESFPQHELAIRLFVSNDRMAGIMSFVLPEDMGKIDAFMKRLKFAHYATTLGGIRTTLNHPVTSSHAHMPDEDRRRMGITPGMFRLSVGIENVADLIADFYQALEVFED